MTKSVHSRRYKQFLALLRQARLDAGLTQEQVAKSFRVPQSWVSKCESGERRVDVVELERFAAAYGKFHLLLPPEGGRMKADPRFQGLPPGFWAHVKLMSESLGYSPKRKRGSSDPFVLHRFDVKEIKATLKKLKLSTAAHFAEDGTPTAEGHRLCDYLNFRAELLENGAEPNLMSRPQAKTEFDKLVAKHKPTVKLPKNKQKGEKKHYLLSRAAPATQRDERRSRSRVDRRALT